MTYSQTINKIIVVWKKPNNSYYYRKYKRILNPFEIGYKNSYNHEVVLIINDLEESNYKIRRSFKSKLKNKIINFIDKKM